MATVSDTLSFARTQAQTDSVGLTDARGLIFANEAMADFRRRLQVAGLDASQTQESYRDGTVDTGTYLFPTDMFWLKTISLNYSDTDLSNYKVATQVDASNLPANRSVEWLRDNASPVSPYFDSRGDQFEIFPTPTSAHNVTQLIRIFYFLTPTDYAAASGTVAYPESLDYRTIGWRIAASYLYSLNKFDEGALFEQKYDDRVKQIIASLGRGTQQPLQATAIQEDGWSY